MGSAQLTGCGGGTTPPRIDPGGPPHQDPDDTWARLLPRLAATIYLTLLSGLLFWSVAPVFMHMQAVVVMSGSMAPSIQPGDVIISARPPVRGLLPGRVLVVRDPSYPERLLSHRLVAMGDDGSLVTRGDANATNDSTKVRPEAVVGAAVFVVPAIGRPMLWWQHAQYLPLALFALATAVALAVVTWPEASGPPDPVALASVP